MKDFFLEDWDDDDEWEDDEWEDDDNSMFDPESFLQNAEQEQFENLMQALLSMNVKDIRTIAKRRRWVISGTAKDGLIEQMIPQFIISLDSPDLFTGLTSDEKKLLAAIHTLYNINNTIFLSNVQRVWSKILNQKSNIGPVLQGLETYGIIYECKNHEGDVHYHPFITLPADVLPVLALFPSQKLKKSNLKTLPPSSDVLLDFEQFGAYLSFGNPVTFTPQLGEVYQDGHDSPWVTNWPHLPAELASLPSYSPYYSYSYNNFKLTVPMRKQLLDPHKNKTLINKFNNAAVADWFTTLCIQLQVLTTIQEKPQQQLALDPEPWSMIVSLPPSQRLQFLYQAWSINLSDLHELRTLFHKKSKTTIVRHPDPETPFQALLFDMMFARQTILRLLRGLAEDETCAHEWHSLDTFIQDICTYHPTLYYSALTPWDWEFKQGQRTLSVEKKGDWLNSFGIMVHSLFSGPLHWLNIVELSGKRKNITAFRITKQGRALLSPQFELDDMDDTTSPGEVIWVDGRTAKVSPGYEVNAFLSLITRLATAVPNKPFTYTLAPEQMEHAFIAGELPDTLNRLFLESGWRLPEEGYRYIEELYGRFGKTHIYEGLTLLEFDDDHTLRELQAAGIINDSIIHEFSPRLIAVNPEMVSTITTRLEKRNYTPRTIKGGI